MSDQVLSAYDIELLADNINNLSPEQRLRLRAIMASRERGFRSNKWIQSIRPNVHPKQALFLSLEHREVLYGGSAGCGKSDALMLAAMQFLDVPGYSAILFRRTFVDLSQSGALMDRARKWFSNTEAKWSAGEKSWFFPTAKGKEDARLAFAYLQDEGDVYNYQGAEFSYVGFDELTQHPFKTYSYLFSRLRRLKDSAVPIRIRSSTNPGGKYGEWVKENWLTQEYLKADPYQQANGVWDKKTDCGECHSTGVMDGSECIYCEGKGYRIRYFVPARLIDNPSLDLAEYSRSLIELPPVERYRLEKGDWSIMEQGNLFKMEWIRYYSRNGDHFILHRDADKGGNKVVEIGSLIFFITADTASKEKTTADFTAIATWAFHSATGSLLLIHVTMSKMEVPQIAPAIIAASKAGKTQFVMVEDAQCGIGVIQELRGPKGGGIAVLPYSPAGRGNDKVSRSTTAQIKMESGQVFFPDGRPGWMDEPIAQIIGFPEMTHDDMVDCLSMAAHYVHTRHQQNFGGIPWEVRPVGR